jgi:hypothetical protein
MEMSLARVVAVHPESNAVDCLILETGSRIPGVQVLSGMPNSTNCGHADLFDPTSPNDWTARMTRDRDIIAVVGWAGSSPVVVGFLFPQVCQMLFDDKRDRRITRHASDVYVSIDKDGNTEVYHPSGTYLRIGEKPEHEDLTSKDFDQKWKITKNTDKAVYAHLSVRNAGAEMASLDFDPEGNVTLMCKKDLTFDVGGNETHKVAGNYKATASRYDHD